MRRHEPSYTDAEHRERECHGSIQSGADFYERTWNDEYLYSFYPNRNDIHGSWKHARLPVE